MIISANKDVPKKALPDGIVFGIEFVKSVERIPVGMHVYIKRIEI